MITIQKKVSPAPGVRVTGLTKLDGMLDLGASITGKVIQANAYAAEDEYAPLYIGGSRSIGAIMPPYNLRQLDRLCQENNTLSPCVEAMVTNIDGTGFDFVKDVLHSDDIEESEDDVNIEKIWDFFAEPYPGETFIAQRKRIRRDVERVGNAYMEIVPSVNDEILYSRYADAKMMRIIKLDDAVKVTITVKRDGKDRDIKTAVRYRKFVQILNGVEVLYFKEFGCPRDLNKKTGKWAKEGERLLPHERATSLIHFMALPDTYTPYGVPRWINQMPSVLGSRKAEEFNVDYFDNGGVPPILIMLQGGTLQPETRRALEQGMMGPAMKKNRVIVVESEPNGGTIDSTTPVRAIVEKFGAEMTKDSMFEGYDDKCEQRVRRSFRLPQLFVGDSSKYSFATAYAAYTVAEAQVFRPEREDFDGVITQKLLPALGYPGYAMKSRGLKIEDATLKLQGIEIGQATQQIDAKCVLDQVNATIGTDLKLSKTLPVPQEMVLGPPISNIPGAAGASTSGRRGVASKKRNQTGTIQSNSTKKNPSKPAKRSPAVSKEEEIIEFSKAFAEAAVKRDAVLMLPMLGEIAMFDVEEVDYFRTHVVEAFDAYQPRAIATS